MLIELFIGPPPVADVRSLTHYGEPYDGNTRFFRSTLFVAAVRSCYGESSLLHGLEWMPPKVSFLVCNGLFSSFVCGYTNAFQLPIDKAISKRKNFFLWFSPVMKQCLHNGVSLDVQVCSNF